MQIPLTMLVGIPLTMLVGNYIHWIFSFTKDKLVSEVSDALYVYLCIGKHYHTSAVYNVFVHFNRWPGRKSYYIYIFAETKDHLYHACIDVPLQSVWCFFKMSPAPVYCSKDYTLYLWPLYCFHGNLQ